MQCIDSQCLASVEFELAHESDEARHTEVLFARRVNFWRDVLPRSLEQNLMGKAPGDAVTVRRKPGRWVEPYSERKVRDLGLDNFVRKRFEDHYVEPRQGRFYPTALLRGVSGSLMEGRPSFRIAALTEQGMGVDLNHPLATRTLDLRAQVEDVAVKDRELGGRCHDWMELLCQGPGMQCRHLGGPTDFFSGDALERKDADDAAFYAEPRLVNHLDDHAVSRITALHGRLLQPGIEVLDLMAAFTPYLPEGLELQRHAGLGLNREELERNPSLTEQVVHDLNPPGGGPRLPFDDASFHAVTCVASWEYLAHPLETAAEVARVLRPGGLCVVSFSNRWFPGKTVRIWPELHDFERMGYVLECLLRTGSFQDLETRSERGRPRPATDRHFPAFPESDPVFAVWGTRKD